MKKDKLARYWPKYWETHNINEDELQRIAARAKDPEEAQDIWDKEDWWTDEETSRNEKEMEVWPRGYSRRLRGELSQDEFRKIINSALDISNYQTERLAQIIYERIIGGETSLPKPE